MRVGGSGAGGERRNTMKEGSEGQGRTAGDQNGRMPRRRSGERDQLKTHRAIKCLTCSSVIPTPPFWAFILCSCCGGVVAAPVSTFLARERERDEGTPLEPPLPHEPHPLRPNLHKHIHQLPQLLIRAQVVLHSLEVRHVVLEQERRRVVDPEPCARSLGIRLREGVELTQTSGRRQRAEAVHPAFEDDDVDLVRRADRHQLVLGDPVALSAVQALVKHGEPHSARAGFGRLERAQDAQRKREVVRPCLAAAGQERVGRV